MLACVLIHYLTMSLPERLIALRKVRGLSQQQMADAIGIHVNSLKKYENGQAQPSLDVFKKIAITFNVSSDALLFEEQNTDDSPMRLIEAIQQLRPEQRHVVNEVLESLLMRYRTRPITKRKHQPSNKEE
jgi:transcriptional regulator with XRE-family HTH domain